MSSSSWMKNGVNSILSLSDPRQDNWDKLSEYFQYTRSSVSLSIPQMPLRASPSDPQGNKNKGVFPSDTALEKHLSCVPQYT